MKVRDKFLVFGMLALLALASAFAYSSEKSLKSFLSKFDNGKFSDNFSWLNQD
jgi:hypothetical protein